MNPLIQLKKAAPAFLVALVCFGLLPTMRAVNPAPDGCYPNFTTAEGCAALSSLTTGFGNTGLGWRSLLLNTTGNFNTGVGVGTLLFNTADSNTAVGAAALLNNTIAVDNTAIGSGALSADTTGAFNTAIGMSALGQLSVGNDNIAIGWHAGFLATGSSNIYIGSGVTGFAGEVSHTYIDNIRGTTVSGSGTDTVMVDLTNGLLGHLGSSRRYKEDIKPMDNTSDALFLLKPVTYHYKKEIDPSQSLAFGLVAEDVAKVNPALVAHNAQGQPESVHYEMVNAMLLNEFLKEHRKVERLEATVAQQHKDFEAAVAQLKGQIQKVSAHLEVSKAAPQTVLNNQ